MALDDPILRPRSKPLRSQRGTTLSKITSVLGATACLALLASAAILFPSFISSSTQARKTVLLEGVLPDERVKRIRAASQSLSGQHSESPSQVLYHGVVYPPNYDGYYDVDGAYRRHPQTRVHHVSVDGGTIGIGNTGKTWFISHEGPAEEASGCTSECDSFQSRLMTASEGMMQAAALNDLKRKEAEEEQGVIAKAWAAKMRAALDVLDPLPAAPSPPKGICHTTVECHDCQKIKEEQDCKEARGVWEPQEDWRGDIRKGEHAVKKQMKERMDEAVELAKQVPS